MDNERVRKRWICLLVRFGGSFKKSAGGGVIGQRLCAPRSMLALSTNEGLVSTNEPKTL